GAAVLPNNGGINWLACFTVPNYGGFTLVCDANCLNIEGGQRCLSHGLSGCLQLGLPNFHRVVLYPSRMREVLAKLVLSHCYNIAFSIEDNTSGTGSALVE